MTLKRLISLITAIALLLCSFAATAEEEAPIVFDVTDFISSLSDLDLTPHKGKVIALFFYDSNTDECLATLPVWKTVYDTFDPLTVEIILVHAWDGEGQEESDALKERFQLEGMHIYEDRGCMLSDSLGVLEYPNTLFLDPHGTPASGYNGQMGQTTITEYLKSLGAQTVIDPQAPAIQ